MRRWQDEFYYGLVAAARGVMDQEKRLTLFQQADRILVDEAPIVPLLHGCFHLLLKPWVRRYPTSPMHSWHLKDVILEPHWAGAAIRRASEGGGFELLDVKPQWEPGIKLNGAGITEQTPLVGETARNSLRPVASEEASHVAPSRKTCEPSSRYWFTASARLRQPVTLNHVVSSQQLPLSDSF